MSTSGGPALCTILCGESRNDVGAQPAEMPALVLLECAVVASVHDWLHFLTLASLPGNFCILPLYILLLAMLPTMLALYWRNPIAMLTVSVGLYACVHYVLLTLVAIRVLAVSCADLMLYGLINVVGWTLCFVVAMVVEHLKSPAARWIAASGNRRHHRM